MLSNSIGIRLIRSSTVKKKNDANIHMNIQQLFKGSFPLSSKK